MLQLHCCRENLSIHLLFLAASEFDCVYGPPRRAYCCSEGNYEQGRLKGAGPEGLQRY
jgi:hypothetical protein